MFTLDDSSNITMLMADMPSVNYYNNEQNIVRIMIGSDKPKYYDFPLTSTTLYPNPEDHKVLVITYNDILNGNNGILEGDDALNYLPGYQNESELSNKYNWGYAMLVHKKIKKNTTNYNDSSTGMFNSKANNPVDDENIKYSISPPINKDYTTTRDEHKEDLNNSNIGVFVTDNSVYLKSGKGSIVLGPDGVSILGQTYHSASKPAKGMVQENPFSGWFPSTMMTIPLGIEYIPNLNMILSIGSACQRLSKSISGVGKVTNITKKLVG